MPLLTTPAINKKKQGYQCQLPEDVKEEEKEAVTVKIDWEDLESRLTILSPKSGNLNNIMTFEGKVVYIASLVNNQSRLEARMAIRHNNVASKTIGNEKPSIPIE